MSTLATAKLYVSLKLDNGNTIDLREGDIVNGLKYRLNGAENIINGSVRVIDAMTSSNTDIPSDCPPEPYAHRYISITSLVIDSSTEYDAELTRIPIAAIIGVDSVTENGGVITVGVGSQYKPLSEVISAAKASTVIELEDGEYTEPITISKSIKIVGGANTIISAPLTIGSLTKASEPISIELDGVSLTGKATIKLNNIDEFTMTNCTFGGHALTEKSYPINITDTNKIKLTINNCTFTKQNEYAYNIIECNGYLKSGSSISNNVFEYGCCTHNQINIYNVEEGAIININNNVCAESKNMVRVGIKGEPTCTINMIGNSYASTDESHDGAWAGLFIVQPYGIATTSFANTTINVEKTTMSNTGGQLYYLHAGASDMQWTTDNQPNIIIDGVIQDPIEIA